MSGAVAIASVSESLRAILLSELSLLSPPVGVTLLAPDEAGQDPRVNLFLYRVDEHSSLRNLDWQADPTRPNKLIPPPLSLQLWYLMTAFATNDAQLGLVTSQELLGDAMRILHEHPVLEGEHVAAELRGARESIRVMLQPLPLEEITNLWSTFSQRYRTSVVYKVSVVQIDMKASRARTIPERVRTIGVPRIATSFIAPSIGGISPHEGPPGTVVTVRGTHLAGHAAYVSLPGQAPIALGALDGDVFEFTVPAGQWLGFMAIRVDIGQLAHSTFPFEVLPP